MKKTIIKYIAITLALLFIAFIVRSCLKTITHKMITDETTIEETSEMEITETEYVPQIASKEDSRLIIIDLLNDEKKEIWSEYPLSENFRKKFKDRYSIINEIGNSRKIGGGIAYDKDNKNIDKIIIYWKDGYRKDNCYETRYYFEYKIVDDKLDDLILLRKVDYDEYGDRIDGKKEVDINNIAAHIYGYLFPNDLSLDNDLTQNVTSDDLIVENKPNLSIPLKSVYRRDRDDNCVYMKFVCSDKNYILKVQYKINDDYQISYLKFNEINEHELPEKFKERFSKIN